MSTVLVLYVWQLRLISKSRQISNCYSYFPTGPLLLARSCELMKRREEIIELGITEHFTLEWKHWNGMNESRLSSHSLEQICLLKSFYWLCRHWCNFYIFFPHSDCTLKHTFLTADSNMLQKMGNCLKLPVLRVRSSMSKKKRIKECGWDYSCLWWHLIYDKCMLLTCWIKVPPPLICCH